MFKDIRLEGDRPGVRSIGRPGHARFLALAWKAVHGATPPPVPADRRSSWTDALSWAIATGVGAGVARLVAIRTAARVWEAAIHERPPESGLEAQTET